MKLVQFISESDLLGRPSANIVNYSVKHVRALGEDKKQRRHTKHISISSK